MSYKAEKAMVNRKHISLPLESCFFNVYITICACFQLGKVYSLIVLNSWMFIYAFIEARAQKWIWQYFTILSFPFCFVEQAVISPLHFHIKLRIGPCHRKVYYACMSIYHYKWRECNETMWDNQSHNNFTSSPNWVIFSQNPFHYKT